MNSQQTLLKMLQQVAPAGGTAGLEAYLKRPTSAADAGSPGLRAELAMEGMAELLSPANLPQVDQRQAELTLEAMNAFESGETLTDAQQFQLEAIVLPYHRPVVDVVQDGLVVSQLTDDWVNYGAEDRRAWTVERTRAIGRLNVPTLSSLPYAGTGFIVGDGLLMTNRHVASIFAQGVGARDVHIPAGTETVIEFSDDGKTQASSLRVRRVVLIHPHWDMALLKVEGLPPDRRPLALSTSDPAGLVGRDVAVIGYPGYDPNGDAKYQDVQNRVFNGRYYIKRFQPGRLQPRERIPTKYATVEAVTHDCSTLGGNSGSAVVDLATGEVVGLHFGGIYLKANYAVSPFDLAQDTRVVDAGVNFHGRVDPRTDYYGPIWHQVEGHTSPTQPESTMSVTTNSINVATAPTGAVSLTIPLHVTIALGTPTATPAAVTAAATTTPRPPLMSVPPTPPGGPLGSMAPEGMFGSALEKVSDNRFQLAALQAEPFGLPAALTLGLASRLAYRPQAEVEQIAHTQWGLEVRFFEIDETQCFAARAGSTVIVAFRGTWELRDWLTNISLLPSTQPYGVVHRGFLGAFQAVQQQLIDLLDGWNVTAVWLTGHSLGGALATIAAAEWQGRYPIVGITTYGQPAVGRGNFQTFIRQHYAGRFFRYVNDDDIVPQVPPNYWHVGQLMKFNASGDMRVKLESVSMHSPMEPHSGTFELGSMMPATMPAEEPPMLSEEEFDRLRAVLLQEKLNGPVAGEPLQPTFQPEGLVPSFRDHSLEQYLAKIAKNLA
jgi:hypothetical protein